MYDTLYAILNKSENATLHYNISYFVRKYRTNLMFSRHPASDSLKLNKYVSFDV